MDGLNILAAKAAALRMKTAAVDPADPGEGQSGSPLGAGQQTLMTAGNRPPVDLPFAPVKFQRFGEVSEKPTPRRRARPGKPMAKPAAKPAPVEAATPQSIDPRRAMQRSLMMKLRGMTGQALSGLHDFWTRKQR